MANSKAIGTAYSDPAIDGGTIDNTPVGNTTKSSGKFTTLNATGATTLDGDAAIGNASTDLVGFHGATAVDQAATVASVTLPGWSAGGYGATGTATMTALIAAVNAISTALKEKGLLADA